MTNWNAQYESDAAERKLVADYVERDMKEGVLQYSRIFHSMVGLKEFTDWPPEERRRAYMAHPPIDFATNGPPMDQPGVFPQWTTLSQIDQGYYQDRVEDYLKLTKEFFA